LSDFYTLLNTPKAYRRLAMEYHPDRNDAPDAEARFKEITEAYEVLRDSEQRALYDRYGESGLKRGGRGFEGFHHVDLSEALNIFMRDFGAGMGGFESMFGGRQSAAESCEHWKRVKYAAATAWPGDPSRRRVAPAVGRVRSGGLPGACSASSCRWPLAPTAIEGRVRGERKVAVEIPEGVADNNYLTLRGQGGAGLRNGVPGDLIVILDIQDDDRFERHGDDLVFDLPVSFSQAALGGAFSVPTPYGDESVEVPAGTQTGTVLRLYGKGLPHLGRSGKGDLHIRLHLWTPERLSSEQETLFNQLAAIEGDPPKPESGFWSKIKEALGA